MARGPPGATDRPRAPRPLPAQLSLAVHGPEKSLEFQARAPGTTFVSTVFAGKAVSSLFDGRWHKVVVAVQSRAVSLHLDCGSISSKPLAPRRALAAEGNAFLGLDAARGTPIRVRTPPWGCGRGGRRGVWVSSRCPFPLQFDLQQAHIYCDAELARQEGCCEISASGVSAEGETEARRGQLSPGGHFLGTWRSGARKLRAPGHGAGRVLLKGAGCPSGAVAPGTPPTPIFSPCSASPKRPRRGVRRS